MPSRITDLVVSLILEVKVVPTCFAADEFRWAPRSLTCSITGIVLPSLLHLCVLSHFLSAASDVKVTDFAGANVARYAAAVDNQVVLKDGLEPRELQAHTEQGYGARYCDFWDTVANFN